jgi:hypothetical protein
MDMRERAKELEELSTRINQNLIAAASSRSPQRPSYLFDEIRNKLEEHCAERSELGLQGGVRNDANRGIPTNSRRA